MKNKKRITAALLALCALTSCGKMNIDSSDSRQRGTTVAAEITPVQANKTDNLSSLSREKIGYGQGVQTDDKNRTVGAVDFNEKYGQYNAKAINDDSKNITLTFDQGYENGYTAKILDTLKEKNVKATFFLVQDYAERNPELVKRMIDEGHIVGNHSVHHYSMPTLDQQACESEIMDFHKYMQENYNYNMTLFRPPMGEYSEYSLAVTKDCGYSTMLWSFAYCDWDVNNQPNEEQSAKKLVNAAHEGAIYLLHSVSQTNADILAQVIDGIKDKGYTITSLK